MIRVEPRPPAPSAAAPTVQDTAGDAHDRALPTCGTGPLGRLGWTLRELADVFRPRGRSTGAR
ncbi:MAG: hypothetical protein ACRDYZ_07020 [Acidimicrobiales bacterium]